MSAVQTRVPVQQDPTPRRAERVVVGLALVAVGGTWFLRSRGVELDWQLLPPAGLLVIGVALLARWGAGGGRAPALVGWGAVLLVVSVALGFGAARYAAPAGDLVLAPAVADWPGETRLSAGNVRVDLTAHDLPTAGRLDVHVGAGNVILLVPDGAAVHVAVQVGTGTIVVDGTRLDDGLDLSWSERSPSEPVVVLLDVALGQVEVEHV